MGTAERRFLILKILCKRRYETIVNLANEFGVSERTVQRDIEIMSMSEPIYTTQGRGVGGVYVVDGYYLANNYLTASQKDVVTKMIDLAEKNKDTMLEEKEIIVLKKILKDFTKPCVNE